MKVLVSIPDKLVKIIDQLVREGEYVTRSAFVNEAVLSQLRTWYEKRLDGGD